MHITPTHFKTVSATGLGDTALWTPTTGKKVRLLGYFIEVTGDAATAGGAVIVIALRDGTTAIGLTHSIFIPGAAGTTMGLGERTGWILLPGGGRLSSAVSTALNVNLSAALTSGAVRVTAIGIEDG